MTGKYDEILPLQQHLRTHILLQYKREMPQGNP